VATNIPRQMHLFVIERAQRRCEYCQKPDDPRINFYRHEVDHIIAEKHGGNTTLGNLAYACFQCNRRKGSDIASLDPHTGTLAHLFNPRRHQWQDHFHLLANGTIVPLTAEGRTTVALLQLNDPLRRQLRAVLITAGTLSPGPA
jgi:HNH endonuclease